MMGVRERLYPWPQDGGSVFVPGRMSHKICTGVPYVIRVVSADVKASNSYLAFTSSDVTHRGPPKTSQLELIPRKFW